MDNDSGLFRKWQLTPRFFWRRVGAFLIDIILAQIVVLTLFAATGLSGQGSVATLFPVSGIAMHCEPSPATDLTEQIETLWPISDGQVRSNLLCAVSRPGTPIQLFLQSTVTTQNGSTSTNRFVQFLVDADGAPLVEETGLQAVGLACLVIFMVLAAMLGWPTPGRLAMGLRIRNNDDALPGPVRRGLRETLRLLPLLIGFASSYWATNAITKPSDITPRILLARDIAENDLGTILFLIFAIPIFTLIWWLGPFLFWRGQTYYDRITGCKVVKV